ncbi:MAG: ParB/RepB/Spo0J family partition protein [Treponema sp.]|nr:ParB/RepB/Spo0J family partition protein [Treponema sp.]
MKYKPTLSSAVKFANAGKLEKWIHLFLRGDGNNKDFSNGLKLEPRRFYAPEMIKFDKLERCCGPEKHMKFQIPETDFIRRVDDIASAYNRGGWDMPPLIVCREENRYELNDGNHRYEALKKLGINQYWAIIWETIKET